MATDDVKNIIDFLNILQEASLIYKATGDDGRATGFKRAFWSIKDYVEGLSEEVKGEKYMVSHEHLTAEEENANNKIFELSGVGASTKQMLLEWAEDGDCERMEDLRERRIDGEPIEINTIDPWFMDRKTSSLTGFAFKRGAVKEEPEE